MITPIARPRENAHYMDNPFASPTSEPDPPAERARKRTFVGIPRGLGRKEHFHKFFITDGQLLGGVLHGPFAHPFLVQHIFAMTLLVGTVCVAALTLFLPAVATFVGWYLLLMFIGVVISAVVLQRFGEQQLRRSAMRYTSVPRTLEVFQQVDSDCFAIQASEVMSLRVLRRGMISVRRDQPGQLDLQLDAATSSQRSLRIVVVSPYDIVAIREELVAAGFPVVNLQ